MLAGALRGYDQWATAEPDWADPPRPGDPGWPRCTACGGFLRMVPDRVVPGVMEDTCTGAAGEDGWTLCGKAARHAPHTVVMHAWTDEHRICRNRRAGWRCRHDNT